MVSSGSVNNDLSSVKSVLSSYSSQISGLDGSWKGTSHDSIISKAESFVSEYTSAIDSGMSAFATACDKYEEYKSYKDALNVAQSNLSQANSLNDSGAQSTYSNQVSEYTEKMNSLKSEIESLLSTASSSKLTATSSTNTVSSSSSNQNDFVNYYQYDYSNPYYDGTTIAKAGCGPTSMAMVLTYLTGKEVDPVEATNYSLEHGTYVSGAGTAWNYFGKIASDYGINCEESGVSSQNIVNSLSNGKTVIMSMGPGTFTRSGHFIVLTGINDDGTISVADPNSEERSNTTYNVDTFVNEGKEMWSFDK